MREAIERSADPGSLLVDKCSGSGRRRSRAPSHRTSSSFREGRLSEAASFWNIPVSDARDRTLTRHNLAVFHHLNALRAELRDGPDGVQRAARMAEWRAALVLWAELLASEGFWDQVARLARDLGDPRIDEAHVARLRAALPGALAGQFAACALARSGEAGAVPLYRETLEQSCWKAEAARAAWEEAVKPLVGRIEAASTQAIERIDASGDKGCTIGCEYHESIKPLLATVKSGLDSGNLVLARVQDERRASSCWAPSLNGNKTRRWRESHEMMLVAKGLASSASMIQRVVENIEIAKGNVENGTCHFLHDRRSSTSRAASSSDVRRGQGHASRQHRQHDLEQVPREGAALQDVCREACGAQAAGRPKGVARGLVLGWRACLLGVAAGVAANSVAGFLSSSASADSSESWPRGRLSCPRSSSGPGPSRSSRTLRPRAGHSETRPRTSGSSHRADGRKGRGCNM